MNIRFCMALTVLALLGAAIPPAWAHGSDETVIETAGTSNPATLVQLETVKRATARFLDEQAAIDAGYVDISVFYQNMGHHYLKPTLLDATFELEQPELLVYAVDPCSGARRLVAVEYAAPVDLVKDAPAGFAGTDDRWTVNQQFQLWTLHVWLYEYNPAGVFASHNVRVP
ncbi:MAG TPA: hypothetical protein VFI92_04620 [Steroidobacteraceae bacterium]|nr:hypothetical protein [Steroidobacteraceae bacterium]